MPETLTAPISEHVGAEEAITAAAAAVDQPLLPGFEPPPFDSKEWGLKIEAKEREIDGKLLAFEKSAKQMKTLKTDYDNANKELHALIRAMRESRLRAEGQLVQPSLRPVPQGVAGSSCRYEQEENAPCPGCILLRKAGAPLPDPEDTEHAEIVRHAFELADDRDELYSVLALRSDGQSVFSDTVEAWSEDEAREVALYLELNAELPADANRIPTPAVLAQATGEAYADDTPADEKTTEQVMADAKVCLCEKPKGKKTCKTCGGSVTGKDAR